jgi:ComF family protein
MTTTSDKSVNNLRASTLEASFLDTAGTVVMHHTQRITSGLIEYAARLCTSLADTLFDIVAPRHCLICQQPLFGNEAVQPALLHVEQSVAGLSTVSSSDDRNNDTHQLRHYQYSRFVCQPCLDALPPAPPAEAIFNRLAATIDNDDLAIRQLFALFSLNTSHRYEQSPKQGNILPTYDISLEPLLYGLKYRSLEDIGVECGILLGQALQHQGWTEYDVIVPVPLHASRMRERGYNQAEAIARGLSLALHVPIEALWIVRTRATTSQTRLSREERRTNVADIFDIHPRLRRQQRRTSTSLPCTNKRILLVDDVVTTGSTLQASALVLLEAGARYVDAVTIAAA